MTERDPRIGAHPNDSGCYFRFWEPYASRLKALIRDGDDQTRDADTRTLDGEEPIRFTLCVMWMPTTGVNR